MNNRIIILVFLFSLISAVLSAQTKDYGAWLTGGLEKKLGKWNIGAETELRTKDTMKQIDRWSLKLGSSYSIFKSLTIGASYEFIYFHDTRYSDYQPRHRGNLYLQGKYRLGSFTFSLRERAQVTKKEDSDRIKSSGKINTYAINPEWIWRNRFKIAYNIPRFPINPSICIESFYQLNNPAGNTFNKLRYTLSFNYNITKKHQLEVYGLLDKDINVADPVKAYVAGVAYVYSF